MRFSELFARFIVRFRWPIVIGVLLITAYFTYLMRFATLPQELADINPKGHPYVELDQYMQKVFRTGVLVEIALEVKQGDVFNVETIGKIHRMAKELYLMPQTIPGQVISFASRSRVQDTITSYDESGYPMVSVKGYHVLAERVLNAPDSITRATHLRDFKRKCLGNPAVYGRLISRDRKSAVILVSFFNEREFKEIFHRVNEIVEKEKDGRHTFYMAGRIYEMGYLHQFMGKIVFVFGVATAVIILILWAAFGTWRGMLMPLWAAYVAVVWGLGSEYLLGFKMDIMTVIVPFFVMAIEVSHCIQILSRFYEEYEKWGDEKRAAEETLAGLVLPGAACIVTDGGGFGTLILIPFTLLQQMGISASYGILRIFFTTTVFIHAFVAILPPPTEKEMQKIYRRNRLFKAVLAKVADLTWEKRGRNLVLGSTAALLVVSLIGASRMVVGETREGSPLFWQDSEINQANRLINAKFYGTNPYQLYIEGQRELDLWDPQVVRKIHRLQRHLEEREDVRGSRSYVDVLISMNQASHDNDPRWAILPRERGLIAEYLERFSRSGGPEVSQGYFEMDFREANLTLFVKDHRGQTIREILRDTNEFLAKSPDIVCVDIKPAAGIIGVYAAIIDTIYYSQISSLWQIYLVIFFFVSLTFRSFMAAIILIIPLGISNLITFATMGFGDIGLFIYTVPVATLGTGLGDYSIYIMSRMQEEAEAGKGPREIFYESLTNSGRAVFFTCLSISIGVATLLLSSIRFQAIMGGMLMVALLANMLGAIILLPTLINWWKPRFIYGKPKVFDSKTTVKPVLK